MADARATRWRWRSVTALDKLVQSQPGLRELADQLRPGLAVLAVIDADKAAEVETDLITVLGYLDAGNLDGAIAVADKHGVGAIVRAALATADQV